MWLPLSLLLSLLLFVFFGSGVVLLNIITLLLTLMIRLLNALVVNAVDSVAVVDEVVAMMVIKIAVVDLR